MCLVFVVAAQEITFCYRLKRAEEFCKKFEDKIVRPIEKLFLIQN